MSKISPKQLLQTAKDHEAQGKASEAAQAYTKLGAYFLQKDLVKEAKGALMKAVNLKPSAPRAFLFLTVCDLKLEDPNTAQLSMVQFTRAVIKSNKVEDYAKRVEEHLAAYPDLRQYFYESILTLDRTSAKPFISLAKAYLDNGESPKALATLLDALKTRTQETVVLDMLKQVLSDQKRDPEIQHIERFESGKLERNDLIALLEEPKNAIPDIPHLPDEPNPKTLSMLIFEVEQELGGELEKDPSHDKVAPLLKEFRSRANAILKDDAKARIDMATAFMEMGLYREAQEELGLIPETDSLFLEGLALLGQIYVAQGSDLAAMETFQRCVRSESILADLGGPAIQVESHYQLALIYLRLGDLKQALNHTKQVERQNPDYRELRAIKNQLRERLGWDPFVIAADNELAQLQDRRRKQR